VSGVIVDCDVHCSVPTRDELGPFLTEYWRDHLTSSQFKTPVSVRCAYPEWLEMLAAPREATALEALREGPLSRSTAAILHCYLGVESLTHPYFGPALAAGLNSWLADEWLGRDDRLLGSAYVAPQHVDAAVAEIERIGGDRRFVQVVLPARAQGYGNQRFWPILEAAAERELVVAIAYGGAGGVPPNPITWLGSFFETYVTAPLAFQSHLASLIMSGIFERCPGLRVTFVESGWTWLPGFCWRLDEEWKAFQREGPWVKEPPAEYVSRHFRFTTHPYDPPETGEQFERLLEHFDFPGVLLFGSDHPHDYADLETGELLSLLPADRCAAILGGNAIDWYRLHDRLPEHGAVAAAPAGA